VKYRSPKSVYYVRLGTDLHPLQVDEEPEDIEWEPEPGAYYTLLHLGKDERSFKVIRIHDLIGIFQREK
jgi:hypothetical protein